MEYQDKLRVKDLEESRAVHQDWVDRLSKRTDLDYLQKEKLELSKASLQRTGKELKDLYSKYY